MKVIDELSAVEIDVDHILALYTGSPPPLPSRRWYTAGEFEKVLPDRIHPKELILHELNLLQPGYDCWAKVDDGRPEGTRWLPVRVER